MIMKPTRSRLSILMMLFVVTAINYMDRANLSVAGSHIQGQFELSPTQLGLLFSMFTWFYAMSQIPVGYILDRVGSRILYGSAIVLWSVFTFVMGFASHHIFATATASFAMLLVCRALIGVAEAPSFPSNTKIIASWFPDHERARHGVLLQRAVHWPGLIDAVTVVYRGRIRLGSLVLSVGRRGNYFWHLLADCLPRSAGQ